MHILMTGGTGLIGRALIKRLRAGGHVLTVLSRVPESAQARFGGEVTIIGTLDEIADHGPFDAVINLAGEPIVGARWTAAQKQRLWDSRVGLTERLIEKLGAAQNMPPVFLSGSAVGYYGDGGNVDLVESAPAGEDFGAKLCVAWEQAAQAANAYGSRVVLLRTGLVLSADGGMLARMLPAFRWGLGGRLGDGRQWMSWIHIDDHVSIVEHLLLNEEAVGAFNLTAPNPVMNAAFTEILASSLNRPAKLPLPAWLLKTGFGEMAELLLGGQRALPEKMIEAGYQFHFAHLEPALRDLLGAGRP